MLNRTREEDEFVTAECERPGDFALWLTLTVKSKTMHTNRNKGFSFVLW